MRLRKGMEDFLVAVPARVPRTEAVQFIRRYGVAGRAVSHYRVYGRGYDAVRKFLDCIGMVEDRDYTVKTSEYDPLTKQIHWLKGGAIGELVSNLVSAGTRFYDTLSKLVAAEKTAEEIVASNVTNILPVGNDTTEETVNLEDVLGVNITDMTSRLVTDFKRYYDHSGDDGITIYECAEDLYYHENDWFPSVLPPHLLEVVLQIRKEAFASLLEKYSLPKTGLFKHVITGATTIFRFLRKGEQVPGVNVLMSTCVADLLTGDRSNNPLIGYFATQASIPHRDEKTSVGAFARIDSVIDSAESLAWIAEDYPRFFGYVRDLYRMAYGDGLNYTFVPGCRIAVANGAACVDEPRCNTPVARGTNEMINTDGTNAVAMMGLFISKKPMPDPLAEFKKEDAPVSIVGSLPEGCSERLFGNTHVDTNDLPLEWFVMTHGVRAGKDGDSESMRADRLVKMRKDFDNVKVLEAYSAFVETNKGIVTEPGGDYSVASAFYAAVVAAFRIRADKIKRSAKAARPKGLCHAEGPVVTGVYSGITTDKSLAMGQESENFTILGSALPEQIKDGPYDLNAKKAFTKAIEAMTSTKAQLKMDKRTDGTPRRHWIVIETNVDGPAFFKTAADLGNFRTDIANAFLRTFVIGNSDPLCSVDEEARSQTVCHSAKDRIISCATRGEYGCHREPSRLSMSFETVFGLSRVPDASVMATGVANWEKKTGVDVRFALDTADRLYVIVTAEGPNVQWARLAYRTFNGLPVRSAPALRKAFPEGTGIEELDGRTVFVREDKMRSGEAFRSVWRRIVANSEYAWDGNLTITAGATPSFGPIVTFDRHHAPEGVERPARRETYREGIAIGIP